jgi:hypothetical protein
LSSSAAAVPTLQSRATTSSPPRIMCVFFIDAPYIGMYRLF